jgi:2,3-bisphosphoglycerate-independent phosphoglycerate mutase
MIVMFHLTIFTAAISKPRGVVLAIIDGFGESAWPEGNAIQAAHLPFLDYLKATFPYVSLVAAQQPVGLIRGEPGSSAVGHQTIGLGRTTPSYFQILERGLNPRSRESLVHNRILRQTFRKSKRLHFLGLCTNEGIFSAYRFFPPFFETAKLEGVSEICIHCILSTLTKKPSQFLKDVEDLIPWGLPARIVAVYPGETAMDRSLNWSLTGLAYNAMIDTANARVMPRTEALRYLDHFPDLCPNFDPVYFEPADHSSMADGDTVFIFHFREDKTWQIAEALMNGIPGKQKARNLTVLPLILYHPGQANVSPVIPPVKYPNSLASWISQHGYRQLRVAEKYKRPHITTFFSGGILQPVFEGEERVVDFESVSENVVDKFPLMNASLVTESVLNGINKNVYKLIACNFANLDATGHTGNVTAVRIAAEFVDKQLEKIHQACEEHGYTLMITADHGNSEEDTQLDGKPQLYHTVNNVPFIAVTHDFEIVRMRTGEVPFLGNVAAAILTVLGLDIPPEMAPSILVPVGRRSALRQSGGRQDFVIGFCFAIVTVLLAVFCIRISKLTRVKHEPMFLTPLVWP